MKKIVVITLFLVVVSATMLFAEDANTNVRWTSIKGVITAPGISNQVAGIDSGGQPWTTTRGHARVNLATGNVAFRVEGLVLNGGNASGTRGGVANVEGTLVCNAGATDQAELNTDVVPLSRLGNAAFEGNLGSVPSPCANPLFLIRVPSGRWIATGAVRATGGGQ